MFRGPPGTPMRRTAREQFVGDAEPEPLTLANRTTKSFTLSMACRPRAAV